MGGGSSLNPIPTETGNTNMDQHNQLQSIKYESSSSSDGSNKSSRGHLKVPKKDNAKNQKYLKEMLKLDSKIKFY